MNKLDKRTRYAQVKANSTTNSKSCLSSSSAIVETVTKSCFPASEVSCLQVATLNTYSPFDSKLSSSIPLTDETHTLTQSMRGHNSGDALVKQSSTYSPKDRNFKAICSILSLVESNSSEENFNEAVANSLRMENEVQLLESHGSVARLTDSKDSTKMVPSPNERGLKQSEEPKPHSMKVDKVSTALEDTSPGHVHKKTAQVGTSFPLSDPTPCVLSTSMPITSRQVSFAVNKATLGRESSALSMQAPPPPSRLVAATHESLDSRKKVSSLASETAPCTSVRRKVMSTKTYPFTFGERTDLETAAGPPRQASSVKMRSRNEPTSFLDIFKKKTSGLGVLLQHGTGPVAGEPVVEHDEAQANPCPAAAVVHLIPLQHWKLVRSKWYKSKQRKLSRRHVLYKMKRAKPQRLLRKAKAPHNGDSAAGCLVNAVVTTREAREVPKAAANNDVVGSPAVKKIDLKLESARRKSLSMSLSTPRFPLPPSPRRCEPKRGREGGAAPPPLAERLNSRQSPQGKNFDPSTMESSSARKPKVDSARRLASNSVFVRLTTSPAPTASASSPSNDTAAIGGQGRRNGCRTPVNSARTPALFKKTEDASCTSLPPRQPLSTGAERSRNFSFPVKEEHESSKFVIIPHLLSLEEKECTATIVFDLDETLCNNRVAGPPLLRPGAIQLLRHLRSMFPRPYYRSLPHSANTMAETESTKTFLTAPNLKFVRSSSTLESCGNTSSQLRYNEDGLRLELILWTASVSSVAKRVVDRLNPYGDIFDQIIYQDPRWYSSDEYYTKDLRLLGRNMDQVVIIENAPASVKCNRRNAILVTDFSHNQNDRQLLVVRSILTEWLNLLSRFVLRQHAKDVCLPSELNEDGSSKLSEECTQLPEESSTHGKSTSLSRIQRAPLGDHTASACGTNPVRRQINAKNKRNGTVAFRSSNTLAQEKAKVSIGQFLSLHKYIQSGTNSIRLSVVSEVARLYEMSSKVKPLEKSNSARRPYANRVDG